MARLARPLVPCGIAWPGQDAYGGFSPNRWGWDWPSQPGFADAERVSLAGFLAGYRGLIREAYALDRRQVAS